MVVAVFSQPLARLFFSPAPPDFSRETAVLDSLEALFRETAAPTAQTILTAREAFRFNPNDATPQDLERLGFLPGIARRIVRYRESGGKFRERSDLLRIYGMDTGVYRQLYPYIDLPERAVRTHARPKATPATAPAATRFDLNTADTLELIAVRGIGTILASRIVRYRERLGGFVNMDQLYEVYRLDSATVEALSAVAYIGDEFIPARMNVNATDEYHLSRHPYIGRNLARLIVTYRFQHGPFRTLEDLMQIHQVDDSVYRRMSAYLTTE